MTREIASYRSWLDVLLLLLVLGCSFMVDMHFYTAFDAMSLFADRLNDSFPIVRFMGSLRSTKRTRASALARRVITQRQKPLGGCDVSQQKSGVLNFGYQSRSVRESFKFHFVRQPAKI